VGSGRETRETRETRGRDLIPMPYALCPMTAVAPLGETPAYPSLPPLYPIPYS